MGTDREQEGVTDLLVLKTVLYLQVIVFYGYASEDLGFTVCCKKIL
jgi:hypothetical protein